MELHTIDIGFEGRADGIATCALETAGGIVLVDPGPASCLDGLRAGLAAAGWSIADVTAILLTHIHLDHAGATGTLVRDNPRLRVFVHERGAPHVIDPSRLLGSAVRIYGDSLATLFGEVAAVPASAVTVLAGGETVEPGGRAFRVEYAPGHALHHLAYLDEDTGTLFVGDTAGERFAPSTFVMPVTPPPDIDLDRWRNTMAMLRSLDAQCLFITHFGAFTDVDRHLAEHETRLDQWATRVRASLAEPGTDEERARRFADEVSHSMNGATSVPDPTPYTHAGVLDSWVGLARYWRKRDGSG